MRKCRMFLVVIAFLFPFQTQASFGDWVRRFVCVAALVGAGVYSITPPTVTIPKKEDLDDRIVSDKFNNDAAAAHRALTNLAKAPNQRPPQVILFAPLVSILDSMDYRLRGAKPLDALLMSHEKNLPLLLSYISLFLLSWEFRRTFYYVSFQDFLKQSERELEEPERVILIDALTPNSPHQRKALSTFVKKYANHSDTETIKVSSWAELVTAVQSQLGTKPWLKNTRFEILITGAPGFFIFPDGSEMKGAKFEEAEIPTSSKNKENRIEIRLTILSSSPNHAYIGMVSPTEPLKEAILKTVSGQVVVLVTPHKPVHIFPHSAGVLQQDPSNRAIQTSWVLMNHFFGIGLFCELWYGHLIGLASTEGRVHAQNYEVSSPKEEVR